MGDEPDGSTHRKDAFPFTIRMDSDHPVSNSERTTPSQSCETTTERLAYRLHATGCHDDFNRRLGCLFRFFRVAVFPVASAVPAAAPSFSDIAAARAAAMTAGVFHVGRRDASGCVRSHGPGGWDGGDQEGGRPPPDRGGERSQKRLRRQDGRVDDPDRRRFPLFQTSFGTAGPSCRRPPIPRFGSAIAAACGATASRPGRRRAAIRSSKGLPMTAGTRKRRPPARHMPKRRSNRKAPREHVGLETVSPFPAAGATRWPLSAGDAVVNRPGSRHRVRSHEGRTVPISRARPVPILEDA